MPPPPTITDTILPPPPLALIMATNITGPTPATSVATSDYLPPATSTTNPSTVDGDSVLICPHCDCKFTSNVILVGHLRIHRTETGELVPGALHTSETAASNALIAYVHSLIAWA
ncbi:unnamed protein product [Schistocephalus solidus]|uniref:C2H2-type domain-containing protein n=1 Tax=Schistocephalus solidus TaxID=70667 RepID=A0A183T4B1_SCHSO|nr:unnamed protein product [Schistocephalus solidus]